MPALSPETVERMRAALSGVVTAFYGTEDGLNYDNVWTVDTLDSAAEAIGQEHTCCQQCGEIRLFGDPATCRCGLVESDRSADAVCSEPVVGDNCNCLDGMRCPRCGATGPFSIVSSCVAVWDDDGTDEVTDIEFWDDSPCRCTHCNHSGHVSDFRALPNNL